MELGKLFKRSVHLYKQNWRQLLLVGLLIGLVDTAETVITEILTGNVGEGYGETVSSLLRFLLVPITASGVFAYLLRLWQGEAAPLFSLFRYCCSWRTYGRVLLFYLCYGISLLVPLLVGILLCLPFLFLLALGAEHRALYGLPWVGMAAVLGWFYLRMLLGQYLFLFRIEEPLWSTIIDGFQMMKGKVASFLLIQLAVVLLSLFYILPTLVIGRADGGFLWSVVISLLGDIVIVPFSVLLSAGFASEVLQQQGVYESLEPDGQG